ncbi:CRISPR-associated protein Csx11 [Thermococcus sp.]
MAEESKSKLEILKENKTTIILSEIGGLIHDLGKLSEEFVKTHSQGKRQGEDKNEYPHHTVILEYDKRGNLEKDAKKLDNVLSGIYTRLPRDDGDTEEVPLIDLIKEHHYFKFDTLEIPWNVNGNSGKAHHKYKKGDHEKIPIILKLLIAVDQFDSHEDRGGAKDEQKEYETYKSTAFGNEKEKINLNELEEERKKVYEKLIEVFQDLNTGNIVEKRRGLLNQVKDSFSKVLGMTARAANDVTLWDHSYMVATTLKALVGQYLLCSYLQTKNDKCKAFLERIREFKQKEGKDKKYKHLIMELKPFSIFAVGWDFFGFIEQSHKIPDIVGRIETLREIRDKIKEIVEEEYVLGNAIYEDDFGIYFLIPSIIEESDIRKVKEKIFNIFNEKTNGILLPVFYMEKPKQNGEFTIGRLLVNAMDKIKDKILQQEIKLIKTLNWVKNWLEDGNTNKLICSVCGKGYYCKDNEKKICDACKRLRNKGRKSLSEQGSLQTIFIDEIAWNPKRKRYENVCLLIAKFELDEWLNGKFVQSLFVRSPVIKKIEWLKGYYNSELYNNLRIIDDKILKLGALRRYIETRNQKIKESAKRQIETALQEFEKLDNFSKNELKDVKRALEQAKELLYEIENNPNKFEKLKKIFESLLNVRIVKDNINKKVKEYESEVLTKDNRKIQKERKLIKEAKNLNEILEKLFQKSASPSRVMRIWRDTTNFFEEIAKEIRESSSDIEECNIKISGLAIKGKEIKEKIAYPVKIPKIGISGEVICEGNCDALTELKVVTPHLSKHLMDNREKVLNSMIEIYHPERNHLVTVARISDVIPVKRGKAYRVISTSPTLFMVLIPAERSLEIVSLIKRKYEDEFGKVYGKLPLHIGLIYFKRKTPMFTVLETAKRMFREFEKAKDRDEIIDLKIVEEPKKRENKVELTVLHNPFKYSLKVPYTLGDGSPDYYHPYLRVKSTENAITIKSDGEEIVQKHVSEIKKGDILEFKPYYLDFIYLDSNIRRFDVGEIRKHWLFTDSKHSPKPYLLWDIDNFERLKKLLIEELELTSSQIMKFYELLIGKMEDWRIRKPPIKLKDSNKKEEHELYSLFEKFVENAIRDVPLRLKVVDGEKSVKSKITKGDYEFLKNSVMSGLFFDFIDLWHTILKFKFKKEGEENE